jgi:PIN domain nuclease of toxin-antitoxin system
VKVLLDTHTLLWWLAGDGTLATKARQVITSPKTTVYVSAASAWEIAIKRTLGKLQAPDDLVAALAANRFQPLPITIEHALYAGSLPRHHDDPFDRMLVAQALLEKLTIITRDTSIPAYNPALISA